MTIYNVFGAFSWSCFWWQLLKKLRSEQKGCQFENNISRCIYFNDKFFVLILNSLKLVPEGPVGNKSALAPKRCQAITWTSDYHISWPYMNSIVVNDFCSVFQICDIFFILMWVGVGDFSKVVTTFNHVGGSLNRFSATTKDVWIIPCFWIWGYVLHVEHDSGVIMNCGQHEWIIPSLFSVAL